MTRALSSRGSRCSSRRTCPGDLYAALPGSHAHGIGYAADAVGAGAVAVLTDSAGRASAPAGVPALVVAEPRRLLGGWPHTSTASPRPRCG